MRLIDADDIVYESIDSSDTCRHERYYGTGILAVRKEDIDAMQPIEERKKGKWGNHGECPFCSYLRQWEDDRFCGNCGADMRGEQE